MSHREISSRLKTSSLPTQVFNEEEHSFACSYTSFEQMSANFTVLTLTRNVCVLNTPVFSSNSNPIVFILRFKLN